jgi:replicative DNA helicase
MAANIRTEQRAVQDESSSLDPLAFSDPDARIAFLAVREVCTRDAPSMAELVAGIRRRPGGDDFDQIRLRQAVADEAVASERHFRSTCAAVREGYEQQLYLDAIADAGEAGIDAESRREFAERFASIVRPPLEHQAADDTDALAVSQRWAEAEEERLIRTGFPFIDGRFGGGLPTGITAICAMPGAGKSALAAMLMLGALENDRSLRAIWFRGEMTEGQLWSRILAAWSSIRSPTVPKITRREASKRTPSARRVNADVANVVGGRLSIIPPPLSADRIVAGIEKHRPHVVVIDYFQRTSAAGFQDKRSELDHVLSVVADLTTKLDLATIVVSSMAGSRTSTADIGALTKESNRLDFDAHTYMALWSEKADKKKDPRPVRLDIAKGRTGGEGVVDLWFSGSGMYFTPQAEERFEDETSAAGRRSDFEAFTMEAGG